MPVVAEKSDKARPRLRVLIGEATALGPGKADLLRHIAETGSISAAARAMGMSYRRAWSLVESMNQSFLGDVVVTATGGRGGGGSRLTPLGLEVLSRYRRMEATAAASVRNEIAGFAKLMAAPPRRG